MRKIFFVRFLLVAFAITFGAIWAEAQTNEFTYQGKLTDSMTPSATYDFEFRLCGAGLVCPIPLGIEQRLGVPVANGIFTVNLDFDGALFDGSFRYLEIRVRRNSGEEWTILAPRQQITSAPYSIKSLKSASADSLSGSCVLCLTDAQIQSIAGNKLSGVITGNGAGLTNLNGANIASGTVTSQQLAPETQPNSTNLKLLGSLRWDLLKTQRTLNIGVQPYGIAFDGANMWTVEFNGSTVKKIRASDNAVLNTFNIGANLRFIAFDGANMWLTSAVPSAAVIKVRASDGTILNTFPLSNAAFDLAFDGENVWVLNGNNVTKIRTSDGANLGTFPTGSSPSKIAFDGAFIWITHGGVGGLRKLRVEDGATLATYPMTTGGGIVFDGSSLWLAVPSAGNLVKIRTLDGAVLGTFSIAAGASELAFDGANLWVMNNDFAAGTVTKVRVADGATLASFAVGALPIDIAFDGGNMWTTNTNGNSLTRLPPAFPQ